MQHVDFKAKFIGKDVDNTDWAHFKWEVTINGVTFPWRAGLGHFTPFVRGGYWGDSIKGKPSREVVTNSELDGWLHKPDAKGVLECLFSDAEAGSYSFNEFCDNFGYSSDSLKALDTYRECMEVLPKLRKALGNNYDTLKNEVQSN